MTMACNQIIAAEVQNLQKRYTVSHDCAYANIRVSGLCADDGDSMSQVQIHISMANRQGQKAVTVSNQGSEQQILSGTWGSGASLSQVVRDVQEELGLMRGDD